MVTFSLLFIFFNTYADNTCLGFNDFIEFKTFFKQTVVKFSFMICVAFIKKNLIFKEKKIRYKF